MTCRHEGCKAFATKSGFCYFHDPARREERLHASRRGGQHSKGGGDVQAICQTVDEAMLNIDIDTVDGLKEIIKHGIALLLSSNYDSIARARGLGYLTKLSSELLELHDFSNRLEKIEANLESRAGGVKIIRSQ